MKNARGIVALVLVCLIIVLSGCDGKGVETTEDVQTTGNVRTTVGSIETTSAIVATKEPSVTNQNGITDTVASQKVVVANMFIQYAQYYDDGYYRFFKNTTQGDVYFGYVFAYNPTSDTFICSCMTNTYVSSYELSDYGSVVFQWGDFKNGYFSGDHRLSYSSTQNVINSIGFEYSVQKFNSNITLGNYAYNVVSNSYPQLTVTEKTEYASTIFACMEQGVSYAQSILYAYNNNITLW